MSRSRPALVASSAGTDRSGPAEATQLRHRRARRGRRAIVWITLTALVALASAAVPARADGITDLYDPGRVIVADLTIPAGSWQALESDPRSYTPATLTLQNGDQQIGPLTVTVKLKGHSSFRPIGQKSALRIKFAKDQRPYGLKSLTLNNMVSDRSLVHETLGYELFRAAGVPAPLTGYAYVRINGAGYGLYLNIEPYDDVSLKRMFGGAGSLHLYEPYDYLIDVDPGRARDFEVHEGSEDDVSDLETLIDVVNDPDGDLSAVADLDEMTRMWATEQFIGHWDGYSVSGRPWQVNYYLRSDSNGRFSMLPWGLDQTFVDAWLPFAGGGLLTLRCIAAPECRSQLDSALAATLQVADAMSIGRRIDELAATLSPWLGCPSAEPVGGSEWASWVLATRQFVRNRRQAVADYLATSVATVPELESTVPPPAGDGCPVTAALPPNQIGSPDSQPVPDTDDETGSQAPPADRQPVTEPLPPPAPRRPRAPVMARVSAKTAAGGPLEIRVDLGPKVSGQVRFTYVAAGATRHFTRQLTRGQVLTSVRLFGGQARIGSGLLRVSFSGDDHTTSWSGSLRASRNPARVRATTVSLTGRRLTVAGTIDRRAGGYVTVKLTKPGVNKTATVPFRAPIRSGRWRLTRRVAADARRDDVLSIAYPGDTDVAGQLITRTIR